MLVDPQKIWPGQAKELSAKKLKGTFPSNPYFRICRQTPPLVKARLMFRLYGKEFYHDWLLQNYPYRIVTNIPPYFELSRSRTEQGLENDWKLICSRFISNNYLSKKHGSDTEEAVDHAITMLARFFQAGITFEIAEGDEEDPVDGDDEMALSFSATSEKLTLKLAEALEAGYGTLPSAFITYDAAMFSEVVAWELGKDSESLSPIGWALGTVKAGLSSAAVTVLPKKVTKTALDTVEIALRQVYRIADATTNQESIMTDLSSERIIPVRGTIESIYSANLALLDDASESVIQPTKVLALLEGSGLGLGGVVFMLADVPVLIGIALRMIILLSYYYGGVKADLDNDIEFVLQILLLGALGSNSKERVKAMEDLTRVMQSQVNDSTPKDKNDVITSIAMTLTPRLLNMKILQVVPLLGSLAAAGCNYIFIHNVAVAARMILRKRFLLCRYEILPKNALLPLPEAIAANEEAPAADECLSMVPSMEPVEPSQAFFQPDPVTFHADFDPLMD